jgi:hypothetical protein
MVCHRPIDTVELFYSTDAFKQSHHCTLGLLLHQTVLAAAALAVAFTYTSLPRLHDPLLWSNHVSEITTALASTRCLVSQTEGTHITQHHLPCTSAECFHSVYSNNTSPTRCRQAGRCYQRDPHQQTLQPELIIAPPSVQHMLNALFGLIGGRKDNAAPAGAALDGNTGDLTTANSFPAQV